MCFSNTSELKKMSAINILCPEKRFCDFSEGIFSVFLSVSVGSIDSKLVLVKLMAWQ